MAAWGNEFYLPRAESISHSFASLTPDSLLSALEDKIRISAWPCNILYIYCKK